MTFHQFPPAGLEEQKDALAKLQRGDRFCVVCCTLAIPAAAKKGTVRCTACPATKKATNCTWCAGLIEDRRAAYAREQGGECRACWACRYWSKGTMGGRVVAVDNLRKRIAVASGPQGSGKTDLSTYSILPPFFIWLRENQEELREEYAETNEEPFTYLEVREWARIRYENEVLRRHALSQEQPRLLPSTV